MRLIKFSHIAIAILGITCCTIAGQAMARHGDNFRGTEISTQQPRINEEEIVRKASELSAALEERLLKLVAAKELAPISEKKDISDVIVKYIPVGTSFSDAEKILRAAKATLADTPPRPARLNDPGYDRYSILGEIMLRHVPFNDVVAAFELQPDRQGSPDAVVKKAQAWIVVDVL